MKVTLNTELYAVVNDETGELVARYTGGFFWTRKGDALNKLHEKLKKSPKYSLLVCKLGVTETISGEEIKRKEAQERERQRLIQIEKNIAEQKRKERIEELKEELKELTGQKELDIPTIKTFLVGNLIVPDYKVKIENVLNQLQELNYSKVR